MASIPFDDAIRQQFYQGWNDMAAMQADWNATGDKKLADLASSSGGGGSISQNYGQAIIDAQNKQIEEETGFLKDYTAKNPFVFDEVAAKTSARAEYEPYYSELLQDYTSGMNLKRETVTDEQKLLKTLKESGDLSRNRSYQDAEARAEEGYAGSGLFFSGIKQRGMGSLRNDYNADVATSNAQYDTSGRGLNRQMEGYNLDEAMKKRDVEREKQERVESGVLTRKKESQTQYYAPLEQSFFRKFPTSSGSALRGYSLSDYYRY